jgi:hypothetical protein
MKPKLREAIGDILVIALVSSARVTNHERASNKCGRPAIPVGIAGKYRSVFFLRAL